MAANNPAVIVRPPIGGPDGGCAAGAHESEHGGPAGGPGSGAGAGAGVGAPVSIATELAIFAAPPPRQPKLSAKAMARLASIGEVLRGFGDALAGARTPAAFGAAFGAALYACRAACNSKLIPAAHKDFVAALLLRSALVAAGVVRTPALDAAVAHAVAQLCDQLRAFGKHVAYRVRGRPALAPLAAVSAEALADVLEALGARAAAAYARLATEAAELADTAAGAAADPVRAFGLAFHVARLACAEKEFPPHYKGGLAARALAAAGAPEAAALVQEACDQIGKFATKKWKVHG